MKNALLFVLFVASSLVAQDVLNKSLVIEPGFNIGVTRVLGIQLDQAAVKTLGAKWTAGKMIPGQVSNTEKLAALGLAGTKTGDRVKVTYIGDDGKKGKFQVEHVGSGKTEVILVAAEALKND